jgi:DNA repair exonuclease SbcCD ATPase subunit
MNRLYIKSILIEGFRGINNKGNPIKINFNKDGITSIFSPNGGGKSSIFDALSYTLNDELKCFKFLERENQDLKTIKNLFHAGDGKIIVELVDDNSIVNSIEFKVNENGVKEIVSDKISAESLINQIKDVFNFLDYKSFTDIINTSPENAGKTFLKLIGYEKFSTVQDKLGSLVRNIERDYNISAKRTEIDNAQARIKISYDTILERLKEIGIIKTKYEQKNIITICERGIKKISPDLSSDNFLEIDINSLIRGINSKEEAFNKAKEELIKINQEKELLKSFLKKVNLFTTLKYKRIVKKLGNAYRILPDEKDKYLGELFEIAIDTYKNFNTIDKNTCLLCNTTNLGARNKSFSEIIEVRILKYKKFKENYTDFKNSWNTLSELCDVLTLESYLVANNKITQKLFSSFYYKEEIINSDYFDSNDFLGLIRTYESVIKKQIADLNNKAKELKKVIPLELILVLTKLSNYNTIQSNLKEIEGFRQVITTNEKYISVAEKWVQYITSVKENFVNANNSLMKEIASEISADTQKFFQEIMMTPEIVPRIEKKDAGQKILMLLQNFYSIPDRKAASLLSESYRNALCLSIYFACALKNKSSSGFIILDDITSSFDGGHQRYLLLLIKNKISRIYNKKGKQVILFTHDGELEKSLKAFQQESNAKWNHYKIFKESNIKIDIKEIDLSKVGFELKNRANRGDFNGLEIRKYFESIILEIHKCLKIPMTYDLANNRDERMLHSLLTNLRNVLKLYRSSSSVRVLSSLPSETDFIDILNVEKDVSNIVSHFETSDGTSYTPSFIVGIINRIESFNNKFKYNCTCPEVGGGMTYFAAINSKRRGKCKC